MNFPVFDLHCDTALALLGETVNEAGSLRKNELHIDLERASSLGGYAQCFACFTTPAMEKWHGVSPVVVFERELATIQREVDKNQDLISIAYSAEEIEENQAAGKMSAVLTLEGTAGIGYDPELLTDIQAIGFRIASLGWNEKNPLTGSHVTGGGLTDQGREFVKEAQRLGILIDVSHISDEGFWDMMKVTQAPIVATHSNSRSVWNNSRNLTDDMFRAIVETGGVAGYNACADFTGENPTVAQGFPGEDLQLGLTTGQVEELPQSFLLPCPGYHGSIIECQFPAGQNGRGFPEECFQLLLQSLGSHVVLADEDDGTAQILAQPCDQMAAVDLADAGDSGRGILVQCFQKRCVFRNCFQKRQ